MTNCLNCATKLFKIIMSLNKDLRGLTDAEVSESRRKHGVNILASPEKDPWWKEFLEKFSNYLEPYNIGIKY